MISEFDIELPLVLLQTLHLLETIFLFLILSIFNYLYHNVNIVYNAVLVITRLFELYTPVNT